MSYSIIILKSEVDANGNSLKADYKTTMMRNVLTVHMAKNSPLNVEICQEIFIATLSLTCNYVHTENTVEVVQRAW